MIISAKNKTNAIMIRIKRLLFGLRPSSSLTSFKEITLTSGSNLPITARASFSTSKSCPDSTSSVIFSAMKSTRAFSTP